MSDFQIHHLANGDFEVAPIPTQRRAGAPRGRVVGHSRVEGAERSQCLSAGRTESASDLPCEVEVDGFITVWPELRT